MVTDTSVDICQHSIEWQTTYRLANNKKMISVGEISVMYLVDFH